MRSPGSVQPGRLAGPFTGRVVDADSGRPIPGARVVGIWVYRRGPGVAAPVGYRRISVRTDSNGEYRIPRLSELPRGSWRTRWVEGTPLVVAAPAGPADEGRVAEFRLLVYKRGYVAYWSDREFPSGRRRLGFAQLGNRVRLTRWVSGFDRLAHVRYIGCIELLGRDGRNELELALAGRVGARQEATEHPVGWLDASKLISEDDLAILYGSRDTYEVRRLPNVPRKPGQDSLHFKAVGQPQTHDFAVRVWARPPSALHRLYERLLHDYPNSRERNLVGDRSFEAENPEILGHVFLSERHGVVVSVTCGRALCKSQGNLLKACRLILTRLGRLQEGRSSPNPSETLKKRERPWVPRLTP